MTPGAPIRPPHAPHTTPGDAPDQRTGAYDVLMELGRGGMGRVQLARATGDAVGAYGFERLVAIKRMHPYLATDQEAFARFLGEARVLGQVHHANVVGVHQVGSDDDGYFLVQDYVEGDSLDGLVDRATLRRERLPPPVVLRIAADALAGLHAVHEATDADGRPLGILHRDLAPQNILVGRDGVTRLADFGIAKHALSSVVTDARYLQGRVLFMPPEYLRRAPVDRRFDIYGFGVTLWFALVGHLPWPEAEDVQIAHLAVTEGIPALAEGGVAMAPAIEAIVAKACRRDPRERWANAREMAEAIERVGRDTGWIATHAEVAALVERLAGRELAARRDALVGKRATEQRALELGATIKAMPVVVSAETPPLIASGAPRSVASREEPERAGSLGTIAVTPASTRAIGGSGARAVGAAVAAVVITAALGVAALRATRVPAAASTSNEAAVAASGASSAAGIDVAAPAGHGIEGTAAGAASAIAIADADGGAPASSVAVVRPPRAPASSAPTPHGAAHPAEPIRLPQTISTSNPYR